MNCTIKKQVYEMRNKQGVMVKEKIIQEKSDILG